SSSSLDLRLIFRIQRLSAATRGIAWNFMGIRKLVEKRIGAGEMMRNKALCTDDLIHGLARIRTDLPANHVFIFAGANHRLGQVRRVGNDGHQSHAVAMTDKVLRDGGAVGPRNAASAGPAFLKMCRVDGQDVGLLLSARTT